jgi:hypothetical protein
MPRLVFCNRYYRLASDELWLGSCAVVGRVMWTVFLCVCLAISAHFLGHCKQSWPMFLYLSLSVVVFLLSIICEVG